MSIYSDFDGCFIESKKKYMPQFYINYEEELNHLMSIVYWAKSVKEAMYCFLNNLQECPKCEHCESNSVFRGAPKYGYYNKFCYQTEDCRKAAASKSGSKEAQEKSRKTSLLKYGTENHMQSKDVLNKRNETYLEKYGGHPWSKDEFRQKIYKTCELKFGSPNPMGSEEVKEKRVNTWLEKYGHANPMYSDEVKKKRITTWINNYGESHHFKVESIKQKHRESCLKSFGYDNPLKSPEIWNSIRDTLEDRYGVRHNMHSPETSDSANSSSFKTYVSYRGNYYRLQGYEHFAVELLEDMRVPFVNDRRDVFNVWYEMNGKERRYYPDIKLSDGTYIEVKSEYTLKNSLEKMYNVIMHNPNISLLVWVFNKDGELINTYDTKELLDRCIKCQT